MITHPLAFGENNDPEQVKDYVQWFDLHCDALRVHVSDLD